MAALEQLAAINLNASRLTEAERNGMRYSTWSNLVDLEHTLLAAYEQALARIGL